MLNLTGSSHQTCDGVSRRSFLQIGAMGIGGLTLADLLRAEALAGNGGRPKSIINIYLSGGPTHMDTFDLKPNAPAEFRGEFMPIATNVPGLEICELFPQLATMGDRFAVIRSVDGVRNEHNSSQSDSGWNSQSLKEQGGRPGIGSVMSKVFGPATTTAEGTAPMAIDLSGFSKPGFLGNIHSAYRPDNIGRRNLQLDRRMTLERFQGRDSLLQGLDKINRDIDATGMMDAMDSFTQRAVSMVTSGRMADALDIKKENPSNLERYNTRKFRDNEKFLMAKRLIEAGVRCVSLSVGGWDTHRGNFDAMRKKLPPLDTALACLLDDLAVSGLLDDTIVMMSGEFGRTPRINKSAGRDHWSKSSFFFLAGGGFKTGQAIGATSRLGEVPQDNPIHLQRIFSTIYRQIGINPDTVQLFDNNGRPQYLADHRESIPELV